MMTTCGDAYPDPRQLTWSTRACTPRTSDLVDGVLELIIELDSFFQIIHLLWANPLTEIRDI